MRVLIIGGTGLTGPPLAKRLAAGGHEVFLLSRGATPVPSDLAARHLKADRNILSDLENAFETASPDAVIDQIAFHGGHVDQVAALRPARHIVCSSAAILGSGLHLNESAPVPTPTTPYLEGKLGVEQRAAACGAIVLRPAYLYGPGHYPLTVFGRDDRLLDRIRRGDAVDLPDDGTLPLQPLFAEDYAAAIVAVLALSNPAPLYHVGGPPTTWKKWFKIIASALGKSLNVREMPFQHLEAGGPLFRDYLKFTLTVTSLHLPEIRWTPLPEGVAVLVEWMEKQNRGSD